MLWDVTDKDIDKMAEAVMQDLGLMPKVDVDGVEAVSTQSKKPKSIAQAVGAARDHCKLKYLTGAAAVTYGIPMYF
jgi:separase